MGDTEKAKRRPDEEDPKSKSTTKKRDRKTFSGQDMEVKK